jgi:hypothetical protein
MITLKAELFHACFGFASVPARCHIASGRSSQLIRDGIAEIGQHAYNSVVTPAGILPRHFREPLLQLRLDGFDGSETLLRFGMASKTKLRLTIPDYFDVRK